MRAEHTLHDLAADMTQIVGRVQRDGHKVVARHVRQGRTLARKYARAKSGPHGARYYKRITDEMTGVLEGEYGPNAGGTPVGGGWRNGPGNTDLPRSADVTAAKFSTAVSRMVADWFWS